MEKHAPATRVKSQLASAVLSLLLVGTLPLCAQSADRIVLGEGFSTYG